MSNQRSDHEPAYSQSVNPIVEAEAIKTAATLVDRSKGDARDHAEEIGRLATVIVVAARREADHQGELRR